MSTAVQTRRQLSVLLAALEALAPTAPMLQQRICYQLHQDREPEHLLVAPPSPAPG